MLGGSILHGREAVGCYYFLSKRSVLSLTNLFLSWKNMILYMCAKLGVNAGDRNVLNQCCTEKYDFS